VLWSKDPSLVDDRGDILRSTNFKHLAIANPKTAPYGVAAMQVLSRLRISPNLVNGESVGQAFLFANSGNAELALIALAQLKNLNVGSHWLVPNDFHKTIEQQSVLIKESAAARNFLDFLSSETALTIIESYGYHRPALLAAPVKLVAR
jgi:molybdate transport system substrate-binding protein